MRKLFITTAALSVLAATSVAANAADVTARPAPYAPPPPSLMHLRRLVGPDFILAATLAGPGLIVTCATPSSA